MKITHEFDFVLDTQRVFRVVLDCLANPGRVGALVPSAQKLGMAQCCLLALGATLLDNEVTFCAAGDGALAGQLAALTLSRQAPAEKADFLFLPAGSWGRMEALLQAAKPGDMVDPHKSATLVLEVPALMGEERYTLTGPGIDGSLELLLSAPVAQAIRARDRRELSFPLGLDLFFLDPAGRLLCLPRTTQAAPHSTER